MPAPATREEFFDLVRKSEVLETERLDAFTRSLTDSGSAIEMPQNLAKRMVDSGLLTVFQAKQILAGKWRGFRLGGKYKLLESIGRGGMGEVFLCEHVFMNRHVAIKVLPKDKLSDPSSVERFYREARAAAKLDHPNIVRAFDIDRDGETHFIVMEYLDASSLQDIVSRHGPLDLPRAANYIRQVALGLQHAHEAGLVHRDIKPGNLLVDRVGTVKILDLGLARILEARKDNLTEKYDDGGTLGTADYLAPEQALGGKVPLTIRADIYSLGATYFFLLTGRAPFQDGTLTQKLLWHQIRKIQSVADFRTDVPPEIAGIIEKMLAKAPEERYETPQAVADALAPWCEKPVDPPPVQWMPKRSLAALKPGAQGDAPVLPAVAPRSPVPRSAPISRPSNSTPSPAKSLPASAALKITAPRSHRDSDRRRPRRKSADAGKAKMIAAIVGGSVLSLSIIFGLVWAFTRKSDLHDSTYPPPVGTQTPSYPPSPATATAPGVIRPENAENYFEKQVTVEMKVAKTGRANTTARFFLNSKTDLSAMDNLTITFTADVFDQFKARGMTDLDSYFLSKTIRVTGTVSRYSGRYQIQVHDANQITFVSPRW
jgi:serine/threonine protein kinase